MAIWCSGRCSSVMVTPPRLVFIVEGYSEQEFLMTLILRLNIPEEVLVYRIFDGYPDLLRGIPAVMKAWRRNENVRFVILCDQDHANCQERKLDIVNAVPNYWRSRTMIRIACHELEAWYLGVQSTLSNVLPAFANVRGKKEFRGNPDKIVSPSRTLRRRVSFKKTELARKMGERISIDDNHSRSMQVFIQGVRTLAADLQII